MTETTSPLHIVCPHCLAVNRVPAERLRESPNCGKCHEPLFDGRPIALTSSNFERHLERNDIPLLVDFWAPWCGPCRSMAPAFEQATAQLEPRARLAKLNTEDEQHLAGRFGIQGIPTLILFQQGREVARRSGAIGAREIVGWVESAS